MEPALAQRVAQLLAADSVGEQALWVDGELPASVREALPAHVRLHAIDEARSPIGPGAPSPAALLLLDDEAGGAAFEQRLGRTCRRFPARVLIWQRDRPGHTPLPAARFFAHGFRQRMLEHDAGLRHALHEYRLADYKRPPDWLNARFWANPERFDLDG